VKTEVVYVKPERHYFHLSCLCAGNPPQVVFRGVRNDTCFLPAAVGLFWGKEFSPVVQILLVDGKQQEGTMQFYLSGASYSCSNLSELAQLALQGCCSFRIGLTQPN